MNIPLFSAIFSIASTVAMGLLIILAVVTGYDSGKMVIAAIVAGLVISVPIALVVTKKISQLTSEPNKG
ncbi:hypothetical protein B0181_11895 [Moraxella caviae]|uniref:CTP synthetase n=1 Tax=Moraxella caviae TaxID=34060 RepID=A0A1S9ZR47_9GAMM|nr:hypothetical protein [Moraxella caviae]OOR85820.1 hypothetical protein B0181_11895 [Moraxella caviae]STZ14796.1 Uncharacterised protein [Moraxella caviae]